MDINEIIEGCKANDPKSQHLLYNMFFEKVKLTCCKYINDEDMVNELTQETFVSCFKNINKFNGLTFGKINNWLMTIIRNKAMDYHRYLKAHRHLNIDEFFNDIKDEPNIDSIYLVFYDKIPNVIGYLSPKYRNVFELYYLEDKTHSEISDILGIKVGTSKSNLHKAKKILKKELIRLNPNF